MLSTGAIACGLFEVWPGSLENASRRTPARPQAALPTSGTPRSTAQTMQSKLCPPHPEEPCRPAACAWPSQWAHCARVNRLYRGENRQPRIRVRDGGRRRVFEHLGGLRHRRVIPQAQVRFSSHSIVEASRPRLHQRRSPVDVLRAQTRDRFTPGSTCHFDSTSGRETGPTLKTRSSCRSPARCES